MNNSLHFYLSCAIGGVCFLIGFILILLGNFLQLLSFAIYPFSHIYWRRINAIVAGCWWTLTSYMMTSLGRVKVSLIGDELPKKENAIVMCNHACWSDIPVLFVLARQKKQIGNMKWMVKDSLKYVPGVGWGMKMLGCFFLRRSWHLDKPILERSFNALCQDNVPLWLMMFPEGTRFEARKQALSNKFAAKYNRPVLKHVLFPRSKAFVLSVKELREHCTAIYDCTILYQGGAPLFSDLFQGKVKPIQVHVKRYDMNHVPDNDKELAHWLIDRFYQKDQLIENL